MELKDKQKLMSEVYSRLDYEGISYSQRAFDTKASIREQHFSYQIEILNNGKYCLVSGDEFMTLTFEDIGELFDAIFFLYHCKN